MKIYIIFLLSIILVSCSPTYYLPNAHLLPTLKSKGEDYIGASKGTTENVTGYELAYARAVTDKLSLLAKLSTYSGSYQEQNFTYYYQNTRAKSSGSGFMGEIGFGHYFKKENFVIENYLIPGLAKLSFVTNHEDEYYTHQSISTKFLRMSWQSSVTYCRKYFELAISGRTSRLDYFDMIGQGRWGRNEQYYLMINKKHYLFEPGITVKAGFKNVKASAQLIRTYNYTKYDFIQDRIRFGIGLDIKF